MLTEEPMKNRDWAALAAVFFIALGLRAVILGQHAFHMDEALYAAWSRRIIEGDLLLTGGLRNDKPPFQMYLGALGLLFFGESESAIRFMNALLSSLECALLAYALLPLAGLAAALGSGLMLAVAPLHRSFGSSAVMDGPLSFFMLLSFVLALRGRAKTSGLAWGLAFASKQTALFLLPWPLLALGAVAGWEKKNAFSFARGAAWVCVPLLLWSALLSNPRLGAFLGMSANQPEVGFAMAGINERLRQWLQLSGGAFPWQALLKPMALAGIPLSLLYARLAKDPQTRAWGFSLAFPIFALAVFAGMQMRQFDRYALPFAWALCAAPAVLGLLAWPWVRKAWGFAVLAMGLAALISARTAALPLDQQGAAGHGNDGYKALLLELRELEPGGGRLLSSQGGIRPMGSWYMNSKWSFLEGGDAMPDDALPLYAAEREGSAPPKERRWKLIKSYDGLGPAPYWLLYRANSGV